MTHHVHEWCIHDAPRQHVTSSAMTKDAARVPRMYAQARQDALDLGLDPDAVLVERVTWQMLGRSRRAIAREDVTHAVRAGGGVE